MYELKRVTRLRTCSAPMPFVLLRSIKEKQEEVGRSIASCIGGMSKKMHDARKITKRRARAALPLLALGGLWTS